MSSRRQPVVHGHNAALHRDIVDHMDDFPRWDGGFRTDLPEFHGTMDSIDFLDWLATIEEILDSDSPLLSGGDYGGGVQNHEAEEEDSSSSKTKKKKPHTLPLKEFSAYSAGKPKGLTRDELSSLSTGPRERSTEELDRSKLGGGFRSYGGGDRDEQPRRQGSFNRESSHEFAPSRDDEIDDWASNKNFAASEPRRYEKREGFGLESSDGGSDSGNWGKKKRGRPRKYDADGNLNQSTLSAGRNSSSESTHDYIEESAKNSASKMEGVQRTEEIEQLGEQISITKKTEDENDQQQHTELLGRTEVSLLRFVSIRGRIVFHRERMMEMKQLQFNCPGKVDRGVVHDDCLKIVLILDYPRPQPWPPDQSIALMRFVPIRGRIVSNRVRMMEMSLQQLTWRTLIML